MSAIEELARALEHYVLNNRGSDAIELAMFIDDLIKDRIATALRDVQQHGAAHE